MVNEHMHLQKGGDVNDMNEMNGGDDIKNFY